MKKTKKYFLVQEICFVLLLLKYKANNNLCLCLNKFCLRDVLTGQQILGRTGHTILSRIAGQEFNPLGGKYQDVLMGRNLNWAENTTVACTAGQKFDPLGKKY